MLFILGALIALVENRFLARIVVAHPGIDAPESFRTLTRRVSVTDDADLREHPAESGTAGDPGDGQRPASPLHACAHVERDDPVDRGGNAEKPQTSWP